MPERRCMVSSSFLRSLAACCTVLFLTVSVQGQSAFTVKYFGLTVHPFGDKTADLQPYKLDKHARFVLNFGAFAGYERFVYKDFVSVKVIQGAFTDCSAGWASVTHLGVRLLLLRNEKHRLYFGVGPTFLVRNSWTRFGDRYTSSGYFNESDTRMLGDVQWKFIPYGCEFEYDYRFTERDYLSVSFTPGIPLACTFAIGWKHWLTIREFDYTKLYVPK